MVRSETGGTRECSVGDGWRGRGESPGSGELGSSGDDGEPHFDGTENRLDRGYHFGRGVVSSALSNGYYRPTLRRLTRSISLAFAITTSLSP